MNKQPICVPGNSTITVPGKLSKLVKNGSYLVESAAHNNLPSGVVVNRSYATSKAGQVVVILINTTSRNIWICQPLLAAKVYEVELHPWQYKSILHREGNTIKVGFQPIVPPEVEGDLQTNQVEVEIKEEQKNPQRRSLPLHYLPLVLVLIPPRTMTLKMRWKNCLSSLI